MSLTHTRIDRLGDQYFCRICGKSWDVLDEDPPECSGTPRLSRQQELMSRHLAHVKRNLPDSSAVKVAWTVYRPSTRRTALAYAGSDQDVIDYAVAVMAWPEGVLVRRFPSMDPAARVGRGVFFEMNPAKLAEASRSAHTPIVSLREFVKGEHE